MATEYPPTCGSALKAIYETVDFHNRTVLGLEEDGLEEKDLSSESLQSSQISARQTKKELVQLKGARTQYQEDIDTVARADTKKKANFRLNNRKKLEGHRKSYQS